MKLARHWQQVLDEEMGYAGYYRLLMAGVGYHGPLAIAGGCIRDKLLGIPGKDVDLFLDGSHFKGKESVAQFCNEFCENINGSRMIGGDLYKPGRQFTSYGGWAEDLDYIQKLTPVRDAPNIDIVIMRPERLRQLGFQPGSPQRDFLKTILSRFDLRLNCVGVDAYGHEMNGHWFEDFENKQLVVQRSRCTDPNTEEGARIYRRLRKFTSGKFAGWSAFRENELGGLSPILDLMDQIVEEAPGDDTDPDHK